MLVAILELRPRRSLMHFNDISLGLSCLLTVKIIYFLNLIVYNRVCIKKTKNLSLFNLKICQAMDLA